MHEMQTIVTNICSVCQSVSHVARSSRLHCAKMAEQIKMLFGLHTHSWEPWNIMLDVGPDSPQKGKGVHC